MSRGWIALRFSEEQVVRWPQSCCKPRSDIYQLRRFLRPAERLLSGLPLLSQNSLLYRGLQKSASPDGQALLGITQNLIFKPDKGEFQMWDHSREWVRLLLRVGLVLYLCLIVGSYEPAIASVHTYPEVSGQVMYRSQQSLRDASGKAWQAVLFKRLKLGQVDCVHLRLVGFPGITELAHPKQLQITTGTGEVWTAADVWIESFLPPNVGEYDIFEVLNQLDSNMPLRLDLPLKNERSVELLVPPFAVQEWRSLVNYPEL